MEKIGLQRIKKIIRGIGYGLEAVFVTLLCGVSVLLCGSISWMFDTWKYLNMDELMYQLNAPITGTNEGMILDYINACIPAVIIVILLVIAVLFGMRKKKGYHLVLGLIAAASVLAAGGSLKYAWDRLDIGNYSKNQSTYSSFIDDNYVSPNDVELKFPEQKRNLIYIYLESLETTFTSKENGGGFEEDTIPELTALAQENEDFSGADPALNGGYSMPSTTWTVAAMFAHSSGLPLVLPGGANSEVAQEVFLPEVQTIGDVLEDAGYRQTLLIGSDATFGSRRQLYMEHGNFDIKDYNYAVEARWIPADYRVWWGYEDEKLFSFAKEELLNLSQSGEPFNLTMLTVDTHFEDGWVCELCQNQFEDDQYANVMACSSHQISEFIQWIRQQDFYENTTIVITGDHPTMDSDFCEDVPEDYVRKMYTVYINPAAETADPSLRREYTTFDDFPTTLAGLGVEIEGNRLGLGTNLFSDEMTLTELYGTDRMAQELQKKSKLMEEFAAGIEPEEEEVVEENLPTALVTVYEYDSISGQLPVQISEINDAGKGIGTVNVAVWTEEDQSDLQWMQAEQQEDGTFWMNIDVPEFNYKTGEYHIDVYLVDADGNQNIIGSTIGVVY